MWNGISWRVKDNDGSYSWKVNPPKTTKLSAGNGKRTWQKNQNASSRIPLIIAAVPMLIKQVGDSGNSSTKEKTKFRCTYTITEKTVDTKTQKMDIPLLADDSKQYLQQRWCVIIYKERWILWSQQVGAAGETAKADQSKVATLDGELSESVQRLLLIPM